MSAPVESKTRRLGGRKAFWLTLAGMLAGGLVLANAHLVYVAIGSQPDCVPHTKSAGEAGVFRAARPSC